MKHLITSALPYINGIKHLGNLVGSMLPADVYARYLRARGHDVVFICATDEHGTPAELAARKENLPVAEYCDKMHLIQRDLYEKFSLSFDYFGRSSAPSNTELTQYMAKRLEENRYLEERSIRQFYSKTDQMFLPDRYIEGTCPYCGYDKARGDQCESCTRVLDPEDLKDPRSAVSGSTDIEIRETKHLFILQSKLVSQLEEWIEEKEGKWPRLVTSIAKKWLKEGLQDRGITRDLKWGIPVNRPGFEDKVFYVWFDAPIAYISTTKDWADANGKDWKKWWGAKNDDVTYTQFMAKDNIPFHSISFPATIIGAGNEFKQPDYIKGFNWLNYYGGKFSTSQGRGIFMDQAIELYPADYWRYYLMSNIPETDDTSFSWEAFADSVNKDLADILGNFINRSYKMNTKYFGDTIPEGGTAGEPEKQLIRKISEYKKEYEEYMDRVEFRKASSALRNIWRAGNEYCDERAPWTAAKAGKMEDVALCLRYLFNVQRVISVISEAYIPTASAKIAEGLELNDNERQWIQDDIATELETLKPGRKVQDSGEILFNKITPEDVEEHKQKFGDKE